MSIHNQFTGAQFLFAVTDIAKENGIFLQVGTDFTEYEEIIKTGRPGQGLGLPFDPKHNDLSHLNAFWIAGWGRDGELIHTQALRQIDLLGLTLSDYMTSRFTDFPPTGLPLDFALSRYNPGPAARRMAGLVCYHGEFWLDEKFRDTGLSCVLARFALATSLLRWSLNYVIGFMPRPLAFKGLAEREGYMHSEPGSLYWRRSDTGKDLEGFMVWMGADDIEHLLSIPLTGLVRIPTPRPDKKAKVLIRVD